MKQVFLALLLCAGAAAAALLVTIDNEPEEPPVAVDKPVKQSPIIPAQPKLTPPTEPDVATYELPGSASVRIGTNYIPPYPAHRLRLERDSSVEGIQPQPLYTENRIVIRKVNLKTDGQDMRISGEINTDFEIDEPPLGGKFQTGQMMGVRIKIQLYEYPDPLKRRSKSVQLPKLTPYYFGNPVEGQSAKVTVSEEDNFGLAKFEFPRLRKPLPPGVYRLIATISFNAQTNKIKDGLKWCSSWYGSEVETIRNPVAQEDDIYIEEVFGNKELHDKHHKEILNNLRQIRDETLLYIGQTICTQEDSFSVNCAIWNKYVEVASWVSVLRKQIDENAAYIKKQLRADGLTKKRIKEMKALNKGQLARAYADIAMYGGRLSDAETRMYQEAVSARAKVLEQIMCFEENLTHKYWLLSDGHLLYSGFNRLNHSGFIAFNACTDGDLSKSKIVRQAKLADRGVLPKFRQKRGEAWKYYLPEIRAIAFRYLDDKYETDIYDSSNWCKQVGNEVKLDTKRWNDFRIKWLADFKPPVDKLLTELDTSVRYAFRKWPLVWEDAQAARNDCIVLSFAWEFHNLQYLEDRDTDAILERWQEQNPRLSDCFKQAQDSPGIVGTRFKERLANIRSNTNQAEYRSAYRRRIEGNE